MNNTAHLHSGTDRHPHRLFDQVLRGLELGQTQQATLLLAGALDGVVAEGGRPQSWREQLLSHPLAGYIFDKRIARRTTGTTMREFAEAIAKLGYSQAMASRNDLTARAIQDCKLSGRSYCALDNLGRVSEYPVSADTIFAVRALDSLQGTEIIRAFADLARLIGPEGTAYISALVPGHFGLGWQQICTGEVTHCHDEAALQDAARTAGLTLTHFRDASDCLVWGVLRLRADSNISGGEK